MYSKVPKGLCFFLAYSSATPDRITSWTRRGSDSNTLFVDGGSMHKRHGLFCGERLLKRESNSSSVRCHACTGSSIYHKVRFSHNVIAKRDVSKVSLMKCLETEEIRRRSQCHRRYLPLPINCCNIIVQYCTNCAWYVLLHQRRLGDDVMLADRGGQL